MNTQPTHKQNPETPIMSDKSDNISDKSLHGSAALLPCPFCGSTEDAPLEEVVHVSMSEHDWRNPSWTVQCDNCTATMGSSDTEEEAIDAWNTRTTDRQALRDEITARYENTWQLWSLDDALKVEQCDRYAAADYMRVIGDSRWSQHGILRGFCDNCSIVIAFARHRIAAVRAAALSELAALDGETM